MILYAIYTFCNAAGNRRENPHSLPKKKGGAHWHVEYMDPRIRSSLYEGAQGSPLYTAPRKNINPSTSGDHIQEEISVREKYHHAFIPSTNWTNLGLSQAMMSPYFKIAQVKHLKYNMCLYEPAITYISLLTIYALIIFYLLPIVIYCYFMNGSYSCRK